MPTPYTADQRTGLHSLVHRWFVEYNPFYLLSAALVFYGSSLLTSGLQSEESLSWSSLSALVSQAYAFALLGGVALLVRIDRRRPAVVLALLFLLYQWDLTLHTETSAYLGTAGLVSALVWLALFVGKLFAIGWALKVRFAPRFLAATTLGAAGLVFGPRLIPELGAVGSGMMVGAWVFALGALGPFSGGITSLAELSPWGRTVLRRATRAAWIVSGVLLGIHVLYFWAKDHEIALAMAWPAIPLLYVRKVRSEGVAWGYVLGVLFFVAVGAPYLLSSVAVLAAAALVLRALSPIFSVRQERLGRGVFVLDALSPEDAAPPGSFVSEPPYRGGGGVQRNAEKEALPSTKAVGLDERLRAYAGAVFALYLGAWTFGWNGGPWPAHLFLLDGALTVAVLLAAWQLRLYSPLVPLAACYANLLPAPQSTAGWGAGIIGLGFALLAGSLAVTYRFRTAPRAEEEGAAFWPAAPGSETARSRGT
ncbi:MAG TPA: hypothetical protein VGI39_24185 [Polyangiaceae bacterium]